MDEKIEYLGDGVYVQVTDVGLKLMANDHQNPTDTVFLDDNVLENFLTFLNQFRRR